MKLADLSKARRKADDLDRMRDLAQRMADGEALSVVLGTGSTSACIVLSDSYLATIRGDIATALNLAVERLEAELAALGVEP